MTVAGQLPLGSMPGTDSDVVEVVTSYLRDEGEVAMVWRVLVRLNAGPLPLAEPLGATVIETGEAVARAEVDQMWGNRSFRVDVTRTAYSAAVRRRTGRRA